MSNILKKFSQYLKVVRNLSTNTIEAYCEDLQIFFAFLKIHFSLEIEKEKMNIFILRNVKEKDIYVFLIYLNYYRDNTASTRSRKLIALRRFFHFLHLYYPSFKMITNPTSNITTPSKIVRLPKYLNFEQAKTIQDIFTKLNSRKPLRNNAIITLFLHSGIRLSELVNLSIFDIDFDKKEAKIVAKGNIERIVFLNDYTISKLKEYLNTRKDSCSALFTSNRNQRISMKVVGVICKKAFQLLGIKDTSNYSTHTLRHTSATIIYNKTNDILLTKEFLGHQSILSTEIYTHLENKRIREAVNKNPLSNFGI